MRIVLFVEGHTERKAIPSFFKRWLDSKVEPRVGLKVVRFDGWPELVKDSPTKAKMYLQKEDVIAVVALLDLYGCKIYPHHLQGNAVACYDWAKNELETKVNHSRFRHFFAVYETEAWLLSNPDIFPPAIKNALPAKVQNPEEVDFDEPPSKLLDSLYRAKTGRSYKKVTYGKDLFDKLDPHIAYSKCPRLKELLDELLKIARGAAHEER
ncbi:MAG: hypothetical protein A3K30_06260 [Deltaproteobacteria bacterium RBG_13_51_10]|nr:MAG: hypothetical protein A3K30_06260 [Deltaproteobacteria bacterium RBG_13_51_10]